GVEPAAAARALGGFTGVRRRLEHCATVDGIALYDDFAHHPTAIEAAIDALRGSRGSEAGEGRLLAVLELASNTMRRGTHRATLGPALSGADAAWVLAPPRGSGLGGWDAHSLAREDGAVRVRDDIDTIVRECCEAARPGDAILMMSNAGFGGIQDRLAAALRARAAARDDGSAGA
ncbi:MAG: UDP-N-acetylmuramate:L-alanyl-gamma-D-glutamyl-meso-diaminopimelate ligase, partial [Chromatiales bacterium]|nr:UDP-N-acetylmuramate:L-alanyl-gamma-D-glutamyl-meso-diaminopimelate ligase [Chromatiales bacterium]